TNVNQEQGQNKGDFRDTLINIAGYLPGLLSAAGGFAGGAAGSVIPVAGTALGGAAGAGVGYFGGKAVENTIKDLFGRQDKSGFQQVNEAAKGSAEAAAWDLAGYGTGKILGKVTKPIGKKIFSWALDKPARVAEKEFVNATRYGTSTLEEKMIKEGITGSSGDILTKADKLVNESWERTLKMARE